MFVIAIMWYIRTYNQHIIDLYQKKEITVNCNSNYGLKVYTQGQNKELPVLFHKKTFAPT